MLLFLATASLLSAPVAMNRTWLTPEDFPIDHVEEGKTVLVLVRLTVAPTGKTQKCQVETSNGDEFIRNKTCMLVRKRGRFKPATDISGKPVYGVYRTVVSWILEPRSDFRPLLTDVELTVARLPAGIESPASVSVMFAVDPEGKISSCTSQPDEKHPALVPTACEEVLKGYNAIPARDESGTAVASVQNAMVGFVVR